MTLDSRLRSKTTQHSHDLILYEVIKIYKSDSDWQEPRFANYSKR